MRKTFAAVAALALLSAQGAPAAEWPADSRHSGAFAGAYFKLPLAGPRAAPSPPRAGLRLSLVHQYRDARAPIARFEADALDIRLSAATRPTLHVAGQPLTDRLGYTDAVAERKSSNWWIPVAVLGGAALIGGAVFLAQVAEGNRNSE